MDESNSMNSRQPDAPTRTNSKRGKSRLSFAVGILVAGGIFFWLGRGIIKNWSQLSVHLSQASPWLLGAAVAIQLSFMLLVSLCYYNSLRLVGANVRVPAAVNVYLASQLGKYVPGKILYVAGQIGLAKWLRISLAQSVLGFIAHHIQLLAMGLLIASPLLGIVLSQQLVVVIIVMAVAGFFILASGIWVKPFNAFQRRRGKPEMETFSPIRAILALLSAGAGWLSYAWVAGILASALIPTLSTNAFAHIGMAAVAAWLLGFLSFITPSGVGVREGVFVLLTRTIIPEPIAMAVAVMMRLILTGLQVPIGAATLAYSIRGQRENVIHG
jgi:hypothetical protein